MKEWRERLSELDTLVRRDSRKAYAFYQEDPAAERELALRGRGLGGFVTAGKAIFLSFLRKLHPARRISYLAGLGLFFWGFWNNDWTAAIFGFLVLNFLLALELSEKLLTKNELEIARAIQFSLYPVSNPRLPRLQVASHFQPAREVGGDYYDFALEGHRRFTVILGDVSGKGIAAALYAMKLQALFELMGRGSLGPKEMLVEMNDVISERIERNYFITAVVGVLDLENDKLVLARAGHNHPLHFSSRTGTASWLKPNGVGIGMRKSPIFDRLLEEVRVPLARGDVLIFYTDGVTEAMNPQMEPFGYPRLEGLLTECAHMTAEDIKQELLRRLDAFRKGQEFGDDVTLVVTKLI
ncbi:MAG: PP2C family protein-serine/threonine phosphatase [Vicinamibacteria bacterium]